MVSLDATWDDQTAPISTNRIFYDFFLVGLNTVPTNFERTKFSASHLSEPYYTYYTVVNGVTQTFHGITLPYPEFAQEKTTISSSTRSAFGATENAMAVTSEKTLYTTVFDATNAVFYNGLSVQLTSNTTGTTFVAPSGTGGANETWTLISFGDVDSDSDCDASDYAAVVNMSLGQGSVSSFSEKSADVNRDTVIDVLDALIYERCASGSNTYIPINN